VATVSAVRPELEAEMIAAYAAGNGISYEQASAVFEDAARQSFNADAMTMKDKPPVGLERAILARRVAKLINREADRQIAAMDRQPVTLVPASAVWDGPDMAYLVRGLVPQTGIGALFGPTGTWKSFVALHMVLCVVFGLGFLGYPVDRKGWCFYLLGEGQAGARRRLRSAMSVLPVEGRDAAPRKLAYGLVPFALDDDEAVGELIAACRAQAGAEPAALVVLDAAADFYPPGASENSQGDMEPVIRAAKRISRELGCFVLLVAHTGYEPGHVRGTSRFGQAWDFEAEVSRHEGRELCGWLDVTKTKEDGLPEARIPFSVFPAEPGSLAVRMGHGAPGEDSDAAAAELPSGWDASATELRIRRDVIRYLHAHASSDQPLSFTRIKDGVTGKQALIRRQLDWLKAWGLAGAVMVKGNEAYCPGDPGSTPADRRWRGYLAEACGAVVADNPEDSSLPA
jgi:AAA domain